MQDIVASLVLRKRVTVTRASSCSSHAAVQLAAHRDMHFFESFSLAIQHGLRSTSSQETALTPAYSKSLGPPPPLWRPQPGRPRSLCRLLHPLPHPQPQAAEVCYSVRYLILCFLDLERHSPFPPTPLRVCPAFRAQSRLSSSIQLPCRRSKKMVCALSYPRHHRHCCPTWPSSPRDDPAPDAKGPPDHKLKACPSRQTARPLRLQLLSRHQPDLFASSALQV